jgi:hypothetical protein
MNFRTLWAQAMLLGLVVLLVGCVGADEPVIPESESIFDPRLVGTWGRGLEGNFSGSTRYVISRLDENRPAYFIEQWNRDESSLLLGRLGHLGEHLVLEVSPYLSRDEPPAGEYNLLLLEFGPIPESQIGPDDLLARRLDPDPLVEALESGELQLSYRRIGQYEVILENPTAELRDRLVAYIERPGVLEIAFDGPLRRITDASLAGPWHEVDAPCLQASPWPEADQMFRRDPRWLGAEAASTLDLADGSVLWIFDNTRFDAAARGGRWGDSARIGNTVALQNGTNPAASSMSFYWRTGSQGEPASFFPWRNDESLRFGSGVRLDDRLVLFFARRRGRIFWPDRHPRYVGWTAMMVENPDDEPYDWRVRSLEAPDNPIGIVLGQAGVQRLGGHVYAFGFQRALRSPAAFVARWPEEQVRQGDLGRPEWWAGEELGWVADSSSAPREPLFETAPHDLSIHFDPKSGRYLALQPVGAGHAVTVRAAPSLVGPWSDPALIRQPSEYQRPGVSIHGTRAHPALTGADRVLTYGMNFSYPWEPPQAAHFPRFVRLARCATEPLQAGLDTPQRLQVPTMASEEEAP